MSLMEPCTATQIWEAACSSPTACNFVHPISTMADAQPMYARAVLCAKRVLLRVFLHKCYMLHKIGRPRRVSPPAGAVFRHPLGRLGGIVRKDQVCGGNSGAAESTHEPTSGQMVW